MNLSRNNYFARYYNWIYDGYPKDLCSFFWGTLIILILSPIMVVGRLVTPSYKGSWNMFGNGILMWLVYLVLLLSGLGIMDTLGYVLYGFLGIYILGPILGILFLGTGVGVPATIVVGGVSAYKQITSVQVVESTTRKAKDWWGAIRGKYCTKITWK